MYYIIIIIIINSNGKCVCLFSQDTYKYQQKTIQEKKMLWKDGKKGKYLIKPEPPTEIWCMTTVVSEIYSVKLNHTTHHHLTDL